MKWEKIYDSLNYYLTVIWMNTFGLVFQIIYTIRINNKILDEDVKRWNYKEMRKDLIKLFIFIGLILLGLYFFFDTSKTLLWISLTMFAFALLGMLAELLRSALDEFIG